VLAEDDPGRALGPALAWARRRGAEELHLLADRETGQLARRAEAFAVPITVWRVEERTLAPTAVEPLPPPPQPAPAHLALVPRSKRVVPSR
jgi:hypothetical protein